MNLKMLCVGMAMCVSCVAMSEPPEIPGGNAPGGGGTPPSGEMPPDGGGEMPGGFSGALVYDDFISVVTNADSTLVRNGIAYGYATAPTAVNLSAVTAELADGTFAGCTSLTAVDLTSSSLTEIPSDCFAGCVNLKTVVLPKTCKTIGANAFAGCSALVSATGANVTVFGTDSFRDCTSLTTVPSTNDAQVGECAFANCPQLSEFFTFSENDATDGSAGGGSDTSTGDGDGTGSSIGDNSGTDTSGGTDALIGGNLSNVNFTKAQTVMGALCDANGERVGIMTLKIGKMNKKGYIKVSGTAKLMTGKSITAKSQSVLVQSDGTASGTITFKSPIAAMTLTLTTDGSFTLLNDSYFMSASAIGGSLSKSSLTFCADINAAPTLDAGWNLLEAALPTNVPITVTNGKTWKFQKAPMVKFKKVDGAYVLVGLDDAAKPNVSALKLNYTANTGLFRGTFKIYATNETGSTPKLKRYTVRVVGFVFDGIGEGTATLSKPASGPWSVIIE